MIKLTDTSREVVDFVKTQIQCGEFLTKLESLLVDVQEDSYDTGFNQGEFDGRNEGYCEGLRKVTITVTRKVSLPELLPARINMIAKKAAEAILGPNPGIGLEAVFIEGMKAMARLTLEVGDKVCPNCGAEVEVFPGGVVCASGCAFILLVNEAKTRVCKREARQDEE